MIAKVSLRLTKQNTQLTLTVTSSFEALKKGLRSHSTACQRDMRMQQSTHSPFSLWLNQQDTLGGRPLRGSSLLQGTDSSRPLANNSTRNRSPLNSPKDGYRPAIQQPLLGQRLRQAVKKVEGKNDLRRTLLCQWTP